MLKKYKIISLIIIGALLISFIAAVLPQTVIAHAIEQNREELSRQNDYLLCENVIAFYEDNLEAFVNEYNSVIESDLKMNASSIEYSKIIYLIEDNTYGAYIDFDGDNGYIVSTGNNMIYDLKVTGDYEYLRTDEDIYFSCADGFLYKDETGKYNTFSEVDINEIMIGALPENNSISISSEYAGSNVTYPGQDEPGDGEIDPKQIDNYVAARYPEYVCATKVQNISSLFLYSHQYETSYYVKYSTDSSGNVIPGIDSLSEGNCVLNSAFVLIRELYFSSLVYNIPFITVANLLSNIQNDPLYQIYGQGIVRSGSGTNVKATSSSGSGNTEYYKWVTNDSYLKSMPELYIDIRDRAVKYYGYTPESGFKYANVPALIEYVTNDKYNNSLKIETSKSVITILHQLQNAIPCLLNITNSLTYGNHSTVLLGYHLYLRNLKILNQSIIIPKYFYELADGWDRSSSKFFDPNAASDLQLSVCYLGE